jgi:hypothetical protein
MVSTVVLDVLLQSDLLLLGYLKVSNSGKDYQKHNSQTLKLQQKGNAAFMEYSRR